MISIQHACHASVLAYAATTKLPPSPGESPSRCDSPSTCVQETELPKHPVTSPVAPTSTKNCHPEGDSAVPLPSTSVPGVPDAQPCQPEDRRSLEPEKTPAMESTQDPAPACPRISDKPTISFAQFATQLRNKTRQDAQKRNLVLRLRDIRKSIYLSIRLLRIGTISQKGLVESIKHGDKSGFVSIYNIVHEIRDSCESTYRRSTHGHDSPIGAPLDSLESDYPCSFAQQLTPRSREDLLEILTLVRADPNFLFQRIGALLPSQISAIVPLVHAFEISDSVFPVASRGRSQSLFSKRTSTNSLVFKDHALAFERTDPLSALVFNVFAASLDSNSSEARLRLDVWSSTCAKLVSHGGSGHYSFVSHLLSIWSTTSEWKLKPRFEIYLMDVLQKGAFLLEFAESPRRSGFDGEAPDPLRTGVAEDFFQSAVGALFDILDDSDGGFPLGALQFGNALIEKLSMIENRKRTLEFIFFQWFFCRFLHNALLFPETHGLLLDFHVSKDAREKLLSQISLRAQSHVSYILRLPPQYSYTEPAIKSHIDNMLSHFSNSLSSQASSPKPSRQVLPTEVNPVEGHLLLSAADIVTILDVLFPKANPQITSTESSHNRSIPPSPSGSQFPRSDKIGRLFEPSFFQGRIDTFASRSPSAKTVFTTEMSFQDATRSFIASNSASPVSPQDSFARNADRIRYELSVIAESEDRQNMDSPSNEDWILFSISGDGKTLNLEPSLEDERAPRRPPRKRYSGNYSSAAHSGDDKEVLQAAIVKLANEFEPRAASSYDHKITSISRDNRSHIMQQFIDAKAFCQARSDFVGAHYWWNAARILDQMYPLGVTIDSDSKLLTPMYSEAKNSSDESSRVIAACESSLTDLTQKLEHIQSMVKESMAGLMRLRNKMWYMTDVKTSLPYEDAKNVALALKTMARLQAMPSLDPGPKTRHGPRSLGGSFLQKPEVQVMNVMKAPGSQGGPAKLADEQVELTRKWLERYGIDNFCKGEERIHRFCYEVKASVSKLVGDTMYETPVLWSSELYQKERSLFEGSSARPVTGLSNGTSVRPSSIASEDSLYHPIHPFTNRSSDHFLRPLGDMSGLDHRSSFQSLTSDRWRSNGTVDTSSIGDSPGRTVSTSTADSFQTFWSPMQTQTQSAASASSFHSRPPSMFSDTPTPRRLDRHAHRKGTFLDDLRQTLTSLLLSDLGSPVWSCGSETDAWFSDYLNQPRIQAEMERRARLEKFLTGYVPTSDGHQSRVERKSRKLRRTRSADSMSLTSREQRLPTSRSQKQLSVPEGCDFDYDTAFRQLMDKFTRQSNPFAKLKVLQDLRSLITASLIASPGRTDPTEGSISKSGRPDNARQRHSLSEGSKLQRLEEQLRTPYPSSPSSGSTISSFPFPSEEQIIQAMRNIILSTQPRTLFRDLQFIAAFIPSETLNKTENGTAFLQFGLAAFALKDDVCTAMVEIADKIVSQELSRRQQRQSIPNLYDFNPQVGGGIRDAANMWIITAQEGNPVAQRELAILYLTDPDILPCVTLPLTMPRDTFKAEMMYRRDEDSKSDPQSMCLALHWMQLSASGGDELARNRLREREEFESIA